MIARLRTCTVEVFQMTKERFDSNHDWPAWLNAAWNRHANDTNSLRRDGRDKYSMWLHAQHGDQLIVPGIWIVRLANSNLTSFSPESFHQTYEVIK